MRIDIAAILKTDMGAAEASKALGALFDNLKASGFTIVSSNINMTTGDYAPLAPLPKPLPQSRLRNRNNPEEQARMAAQMKAFQSLLDWAHSIDKTMANTRMVSSNEFSAYKCGHRRVKEEKARDIIARMIQRGDCGSELIAQFRPLTSREELLISLTTTPGAESAQPI